MDSGKTKQDEKTQEALYYTVTLANLKNCCHLIRAWGGKRYSSKTPLDLLVTSFLVVLIWGNSMNREREANCYPLLFMPYDNSQMFSMLY